MAEMSLDVKIALMETWEQRLKLLRIRMGNGGPILELIDEWLAEIEYVRDRARSGQNE